MIWLAFLRANWKLLAILAVATGAYFAIHHYAYVAGYAAADGPWRARFQTAQVELAKANARVVTLEQAQEAISNDAAQTLRDATTELENRTAAADGRIRELVQKLATAHSCHQPVPAMAGSPAPDARAAESNRRAAEAGGRLTELARDCAGDALKVTAWQAWYSAQRELIGKVER